MEEGTEQQLSCVHSLHSTVDNFLPSEIYPDTQPQSVNRGPGTLPRNTESSKQTTGWHFFIFQDSPFCSLLFNFFVMLSVTSQGKQSLQTPVPFTSALRTCTQWASPALTFTDSSSIRRRLFSDRRSLFLDSVCCSWVSSSASYSRLPSWNSRNSSCVFSALERNSSNRVHHSEQRKKHLLYIRGKKTTALERRRLYALLQGTYSIGRESHMQMFLCHTWEVTP